MRLPHYGIKILGPVFSCRNDELIHVCKLQKIDGSWQMGCISCSLLVRTPARANSSGRCPHRPLKKKLQFEMHPADERKSSDR